MNACPFPSRVNRLTSPCDLQHTERVLLLLLLRLLLLLCLHSRRRGFSEWRSRHFNAVSCSVSGECSRVGVMRCHRTNMRLGSVHIGSHTHTIPSIVNLSRGYCGHVDDEYHRTRITRCVRRVMPLNESAAKKNVCPVFIVPVYMYI